VVASAVLGLDADEPAAVEDPAHDLGALVDRRARALGRRSERLCERARVDLPVSRRPEPAGAGGRKPRLELATAPRQEPLDLEPDHASTHDDDVAPVAHLSSHLPPCAGITRIRFDGRRLGRPLSLLGSRSSNEVYAAIPSCPWARRSKSGLREVDSPSSPRPGTSPCSRRRSRAVSTWSSSVTTRRRSKRRRSAAT